MHDLYNNQNIDFNIRQIWLKLSRLYNQKAVENDLTLSIGFILLIIDKTGTPSTQIGPNMGMEPTSLSRTLKLMEETGLIYRVEDLIDKRKVLVFLTEKGILQRKNAKAIVVDFNMKVKSKIAKGKLKTFFEVLEKLDAIVEDDLKKLNIKQK
jgi:DNA-binding MarR family transcriptional regulator